MQLILDHRADDARRAALEAIMTGRDTREMATMWFVLSAMAPHRHPTVYAPIEIARDGWGAHVGDLLEIEARPIPNIVSGEQHRISIRLPHGFEVGAAEMASGSTHTTGGAAPLGLPKDSHAHFARLHLTCDGVVHA